MIILADMCVTVVMNFKKRTWPAVNVKKLKMLPLEEELFQPGRVRPGTRRGVGELCLVDQPYRSVS